MFEGLVRAEGGSSVLLFVRMFHRTLSEYLWEDATGAVHTISPHATLVLSWTALVSGSCRSSVEGWRTCVLAFLDVIYTVESGLGVLLFVSVFHLRRLVCQFIWSHPFVGQFFLPLTSIPPCAPFLVGYSFALSFCFGRTFALSSFCRGHFHPSLFFSGEAPVATFGSGHFHVPLCSNALTSFFSSSFRHTHLWCCPNSLSLIVFRHWPPPLALQTVAIFSLSSNTAGEERELAEVFFRFQTLFSICCAHTCSVSHRFTPFLTLFPHT